MYEEFEEIPQELYEEAFKRASEFIDNGMKSEDKKQMRVMDWEKDEPILFPSINKVAGFETEWIKLFIAKTDEMIIPRAKIPIIMNFVFLKQNEISFKR